MRRRDFIKVIAGSAAAWPLAARAQQPRRVGVLMANYAPLAEGNPRGPYQDDQARDCVEVVVTR